ncbi:MAG TPA: tyrosine--tRNA ligase [Candidatus Paceibacterota bacterium]|nr:tyrosine--tRNA ligase [Candidatus Paceibacterota bacterium]
MAEKKQINKDAVEQVLTRNVEEVIDEGHLRAALLSGKKLRVKLGIDPTGDKIHIGRAVLLWKLREFQDLGHTIVLIIGDFTAQVGDPSDKMEKRPFLSPAQIKKNLKNYLAQIGRIIDLKKTEIRYNSEWLSKLNFQEISQLAENFTIQQMVERRNFKDRWDAHKEISMREMLYPLMQGYDSVAIKADVELGGTDQLFNLLAGRKIQERYGQKPQDVMTNKMLMGTDGRKMSTSWGNVINIIDGPEDQFGKVMSVHDDQIANYFHLATDVPEAEIKKHIDGIKGGDNPKKVKEILAFEVVKRYHGEKKARAAAENFAKTFSRRETPDVIPALKIATGTILPVDLIIASGVFKSRSEARRLIEQGGFDVDNRPCRDPQSPLVLKGGEVIKVGKKRFFKVVL